MKRVLIVLLLSGCFSEWKLSGPWACGEQSVCAEGYVCDDGLCCVPGGSPACPTLPVDGGCPGGVASRVMYRDEDEDGEGAPTTGRSFCSAPIKETWVLSKGDCDDHDPTINPKATERCNAIDDDCNGVIDDGTTRTRWYRDDDHDGFGDACDAGCVLEACAQPMGFVPRAGDCAPGDATRYPGAPEHCNDLDDNCDGLNDDAPFDDVENPGDPAGARFDCSTAELGQCRAGGLQCLFSPALGHFSKVCVSRARPSAELCGDNVDNDCDGQIDNPPGCGGPRSLIGARGALFQALRVDLPLTTSGSGLPPRCLAGDPSGKTMGWLNPAWVGSSAAGTHARHVLSMESPKGVSWDLSSSSVALELNLNLAFFINNHPSGWGSATWFQNPVITLCGASADQYVRFISTNGFNGSVSTTVHPWAPEGVWQVENGPLALDRKQVHSVEVVVSPVPPDSGVVTFTLEVGAPTGFH